MSRQLTRVCSACRHRKYVREFGRKYGRKDHRLDTRCKSCRSKYDRQRHGSRAKPVCVDCGKRSHFRRCEACRGKHQASAEAAIGVTEQSPTICVLPTWHGRCGQALSFGTDFLGRTTMVCNVHGETLMPVIGLHEYPQRVEFEDDLEASVERASLAPVETANSHLSGMHWRQKSNEYLSRGAA